MFLYFHPEIILNFVLSVAKVSLNWVVRCGIGRSPSVGRVVRAELEEKTFSFNAFTFNLYFRFSD